MTARRVNDWLEQELLDDWHVIADLESMEVGIDRRTKLFGVDLVATVFATSEIRVERPDTGRSVASQKKYGFLWASLGSPDRDVVEISEAREVDRHLVTGGSIAVNVSGLRLVENFLDMGHFPFIHTDYLGVEPHTEVPPYSVEISSDDELWTRDCRFFQPVASPTAKGGFMVDYVYRVIRPYTVSLYKSNPNQQERMDSIYLFVQPVDEENCVAHPYLCYLKDGIDEATVRWFMQLIFAQDKPILENQFPKRLPLDPRAETPIRADASSVFYRRWLRSHKINYGAITAAG
ncbi:aromatic ring-hydroxylating dioxygenase subunit alpha [Pelagibius sp. Alg239-R121]|uniref:aromatic ring-hydroxylating oxygenase subunit alpha n=1 Tax=Pelagibius sp. Alg239-R121 TaxID=2993448 RepID=UPI0024A6C61C|nr:aromatic ring-hydroxylating dioxygenase subunit alpha [Pelagibius sp. Alg239-R121]